MSILAASAPAQEGRWQRFGDSHFDLFGSAVSATPDLNGDGVADVLVGAPQADFCGPESGAAYLLSGSDGSLLRTFFGANPNDRYGSSVDAVGDIDGDGVVDLLVGATQRQVGNGYVQLLSGASGLVILTLEGTANFGQFGAAVSAAGDVNRDGVDDFLVGAPLANRVGQATLFSGSGGVLFTMNGTQISDSVGSSMSALGDINGDGFPEVLIGASQLFTSRPGYVTVISGADGQTLHSITGQLGGDSFGFAVAGGADIDGDLIPDFVVGAPQLVELCNPSGYARVFSGASASMLYEFRGLRSNDAFGAAVAIDDDANGDGHDDILIGAPQSFLDCGFGRTGYVRLYSGNTGLQLYELQGDTLGDPYGGNFGGAVTFVPDIDGNGIAEIAVGAASEASGPGQQPGRVDMYLGNDLFLEARPRQVTTGATLILNTAEGAPGAPTIVTLREVNGIRLLLLIGPVALFGTSGHRPIKLTIPHGLAGITLGFEAYAISRRGSLIHSAIERVSFR